MLKERVLAAASDDIPLHPITRISLFKKQEIDLELFLNTCKKIKSIYMSHYENWRMSITKVVKRDSLQQAKERSDELDLRLHMWRPRSIRIERDIKDVRSLELGVHKKIFDKLKITVNQRYINIRLAAKVMLSNVGQESIKFQQSVSKIGHGLDRPKTSKSAPKGSAAEKRADAILNTNMLRISPPWYLDTIIRLRKEAETMHQNSFKQRQSLLASFLATSAIEYDLIDQALSEFNSLLIPFEHGGNFSEREIDIYNKHIDTIHDETERVREDMNNLIETSVNDVNEDIKKQKVEFEKYLNNLGQDVKFCESILKVLNSCVNRIKTEVLNSR